MKYSSRYLFPELLICRKRCVEGRRAGFSKLGEVEGEERDPVLSLAGH
jgi:hypothetical protein